MKKIFLLLLFLLIGTTAVAEGTYSFSMYPERENNTYSRLEKEVNLNTNLKDYENPVQVKYEVYKPGEGGYPLYEQVSSPLMDTSQSLWKTYLFTIAIQNSGPGIKLGEWTIKVFINTTGVLDQWSTEPDLVQKFTTVIIEAEPPFAYTASFHSEYPTTDANKQDVFYTNDATLVSKIWFDYYQEPTKIKRILEIS